MKKLLITLLTITTLLTFTGCKSSESSDKNEVKEQTEIVLTDDDVQEQEQQEEVQTIEETSEQEEIQEDNEEVKKEETTKKVEEMAKEENENTMTTTKDKKDTSEKKNKTSLTEEKDTTSKIEEKSEIKSNDSNTSEVIKKQSGLDNTDSGDEKNSKETADKDIDTGSSLDSVDARVEQILAQMDLKEKVCQMFIVFPDSLTGVKNTQKSYEITKNALKKYPVGGLLYRQGNISSGQQIRKMIKGIQSDSQIPLFIASDEEGGRVARVMQALQSYSMNEMFSYKDQGEDKAYKNAIVIAEGIKKYGFNMDFAPVADVWSNEANKVIGNRAYSDDYEQAAKLVAAAVRGFKHENIISTLKHFPGHGDTKEDSHVGSAYVTKSLDKLRKEEFLPFKMGIGAHADMVMIGHLIVSDVDDKPATLSKKIVTDILRNELNFRGVIITDALNMKAMTDSYGSAYITVQAVKAGSDILLCPANLEKSVNALIKAVEDGVISEKRIDESVRRILKLKLQRGIIK